MLNNIDSMNMFYRVFNIFSELNHIYIYRKHLLKFKSIRKCIIKQEIQVNRNFQCHKNLIFLGINK